MPQAQNPMVLIGELVKMLNLYSNLGVTHHSNMNKDKIQLQNHLQLKATNCSNKLTCVKNDMCIAHDYLSKLNPIIPS